MREKIAALEHQFAEAEATSDARKAEVDALAEGLRAERERAELAGQYEQWLRVIGESIGCNHLNEQLAVCVARRLDALEGMVREAYAARDNAERMQAIWGAKTVWGSGYEAACRAAEMRLPVYPARDDYPPTPTSFLESVGIHSPKGT